MIVKTLLFISGLLGFANAWAEGLPMSVVQALTSAGIPQEAVSVFVQRVDMTVPQIAIQADRPMSPASVMKLLTTYAALDKLGDAYGWVTRVYADSPIRDGVLKGNLIFQGGGDPALSFESFQSLLAFLKAQGLQEIRGDLVIDNHWAQSPVEVPLAFDNQPYRAYNAIPEAMMVNGKAIEVSFEVQQANINIHLEPEMDNLKVVNHMRLGELPCSGWKERLNLSVGHQGQQASVVFRGIYPRSCDHQTMELAPLNGVDYMAGLFRRMWQAEGGQWAGEVQQRKTSSKAQLLIEWPSVPLAEVVRLTNKYSNNLMARQLLMTLGAEYSQLPAGADQGVTALSTWLQSKQLHFPELTIENGSGLSRQERISTEHLGLLLLSAWRSSEKQSFLDSLPVAGVDGTLERRFIQSPIRGHARMKTGSLEGVKALAGYLQDQQEKEWVVVFIVNHPHAASAWEAEQALLEWLYSVPAMNSESD